MINIKIRQKNEKSLCFLLSVLLYGCVNIPSVHQGARDIVAIPNMEYQEQEKRQISNRTDTTDSRVSLTPSEQIRNDNAATNIPSEVNHNNNNIRTNPRQIFRSNEIHHKTGTPQAVDTKIEFPTSSCHTPIKDYKKIPLVIPKPDYVSPNESHIIEVQGRRRAVYAFDLLNQAISSYINIKSILNEWENALSAAEHKFWKYYDQYGKVNPSLRDEFGYWLHRRETWQAARNKISLELGPQHAKTYNFILAGFSRPSEFTWKSIDFVILQQSLDKLIKSNEYLEYFKKLSNNSFLKNSACSPAKSPDPLDQITAKLISPFAEINSYDREILKQIVIWKNNQNGDIYRLLDHINQLPDLYLDASYDIGSEILKYLSGPVNLNDEKKRAYTDKMIYDKNHQLSTNNHNKDEFETQREFTISSIDSSIFFGPRKMFAYIPPTLKTFRNIALTFNELQACASKKYHEAVDFLYERNSARAHNLAMKTDLEGAYFRREAANLAYIGCLSDQGFNDPIVPIRLKRFGL